MFLAFLYKELSEDMSDNELISLGELTEYETTEWRFPDTQNCPLRSCAIHFESRKIAMEHYRENHAKHAVLCEICNYPIMLLSATHHLVGHFARKHPNVEPPQKVETDRVKHNICFKKKCKISDNFCRFFNRKNAHTVKKVSKTMCIATIT